MNKRAVVTIYISYFIAALVIVAIAAVFAPLGTRVSTELYLAGDDILATTNDSIQGISNATVRSALTDAISEARGAAQDNITITSDIFQYGWVIMLVLTAIIVFLLTRRVVELQGPPGGFV